MQHLAAPPGACGAPQAGLRLGRACSSQAAARLRPVQAAARPAGRPVSSSSSSSAAGGRRRSRLGAAAADNGAVERVEPTVALEPAQLDKAIQRAVRQLSGVTASADFDQAELEAAIHRTLKKEIDDEVHAAFAEEMEGVKKNVKEVRVARGARLAATSGCCAAGGGRTQARRGLPPPTARLLPLLHAPFLCAGGGCCAARRPDEGAAGCRPGQCGAAGTHLAEAPP